MRIIKFSIHNKIYDLLRIPILHVMKNEIHLEIQYMIIRRLYNGISNELTHTQIHVQLKRDINAQEKIL